VKPKAYDLYCGKGGWTRGLLDAGFEVIGFDIERHADYPAQLVIQDVLTIHGRQLRDAALIVSSSPCQKYSYMAMPWTRAKAQAAWYRESPARQVELNALFNASFRIQQEASEAAGRHIPLVAENVKGAQPWVGRAKGHYGSFYLWGDVPALIPVASLRKGFGNSSWFFSAATRSDPREASQYSFRSDAVKQHGSGAAWFDEGFIKFPSRSERRKAASAQIAMIPYPLARWIGEVYREVSQ